MDFTPAAAASRLSQHVSSLRESGRPDDAMAAILDELEKFRALPAPDPDRTAAIAISFELRALVNRDLGNLDHACSDYRQAIDRLEELPDQMENLARLHLALAETYDASGDKERSIVAWEKAASQFERSEPPLLMEVAAIHRKLGRIREESGDFDRAENHFLKSLEILYSLKGKSHEETAAAAHQLGMLYQNAGFYEPALEMHNMALEVRRNLFGDLHPETSESHNNLGIALFKTGDRSWARRHFEKALTGYEALGRTFNQDLERVAGNYCDYLREMGEGTLAEVIAGRVKEVVGPRPIPRLVASEPSL